MKTRLLEGVDSCSCICVVGGCGFVVAAGLGAWAQGSTPRSVACVVNSSIGYRVSCDALVTRVSGVA